MNSAAKRIVGDTEMVKNPDVDGGLVSAQEVPLYDATRIVDELAAIGVAADWAPAELSERSRERFAWLYIAPTT